MKMFQKGINQYPVMFVTKLMQGMFHVKSFRFHYLENRFSASTWIDFWRDIAWPTNETKYNAHFLEEFIPTEPTIKQVGESLEDYGVTEVREAKHQEWKPKSVIGAIKDRYIDFCKEARPWLGIR